MIQLTNVIPSISASQAERTVRSLLERADIQVGGNRPHDIQVHNPAFYTRALRDGRLGVGESYMAGEWDAIALDQFIAQLLLARLNEQVQDWRTILYVAAARTFNLQNATRVFQAGERHYDIGNDLYQAMLGETLSYTCAYWKNAKTLDEAQRAKLDLICRKVGLRPGMKVLELGCGWGTFAKYAAEHYGAEVTGYTVSKEQVALGRELCKGLPVDLRLEDYRNARGAYDRVISIGMMEHVGYKNHRAYFETVDRCLKPDGIAFVHTIGSNYSQKIIDSFFHKYLFPNALIPSLAQINGAMEGLFVPEDVHNIGPDYDPTLMAWNENFEAAWPSLRKNYDERFYRLWRFYLLSSAGSFRARFTQLYQVVMTREGRLQPACRLS
ncbi:MAG TPA: cyclopropane fatty acyl phospholipid synthase [Polyangiaceae bacterium]|nr:cyclopropane fatty acyl phospholipid synthase [Polyangiaceae bacterium]